MASKNLFQGATIRGRVFASKLLRNPMLKCISIVKQQSKPIVYHGKQQLLKILVWLIQYNLARCRRRLSSKLAERVHEGPIRTKLTDIRRISKEIRLGQWLRVNLVMEIRPR